MELEDCSYCIMCIPVEQTTSCPKRNVLLHHLQCDLCWSSRISIVIVGRKSKTFDDQLPEVIVGVQCLQPRLIARPDFEELIRVEILRVFRMRRRHGVRRDGSTARR